MLAGREQPPARRAEAPNQPVDPQTADTTDRARTRRRPHERGDDRAQRLREFRSATARSMHSLEDMVVSHPATPANQAERPAGLVDARATALAQHRYDRIAPIYDALEWMVEWRARRWRRELWSRVGAGRIIELGVGTGKNLRYYPPEQEIVAMDLSEKLLIVTKTNVRDIATVVYQVDPHQIN